MKITCETIRKIEEETTCRKEYCCPKMKKAMNSLKGTYGKYYSNFLLKDNTIRMETHSDYDGGSHDEKINFCPWCGVKVVIEKVKVDNTGLPPKPLEEIKEEPKKKKHWWNRD